MSVKCGGGHENLRFPPALNHSFLSGMPRNSVKCLHRWLSLWPQWFFHSHLKCTHARRTETAHCTVWRAAPVHKHQHHGSLPVINGTSRWDDAKICKDACVPHKNRVAISGRSNQNITGCAILFEVFASRGPCSLYLRYYYQFFWGYPLFGYHLQASDGFRCMAWSTCQHSSYYTTNSSWWFQPLWKILVKLDHFPK